MEEKKKGKMEKNEEEDEKKKKEKVHRNHVSSGLTQVLSCYHRFNNFTKQRLSFFQRY